MRKLIYILILLPRIVFGQASGTSRLVTMTSIYNPGNTQQFTVFVPKDSATSGHKSPLLINMNGAGQVGFTTVDANSPQGMIDNNNWSTITYDSAKHRFTTMIVITPHKPSGGSGNWEGFRIKDALYYAKHDPRVMNLIDFTQVIVTGLSLGGGGAVHILSDSAYFINQISGIGCFSPTGDLDDSTFMRLTNQLQKNVIFIDAVTDNNSQTQSYGASMLVRRSFSPWNGYANPPKFIWPSSGDHSTGWKDGYDTSGYIASYKTYNVDSTSYHGGNSAWLSKSFLSYPTPLEKLLQTEVSITPPTNTPPVSNAGSNQTITLPTSSVTLNGSASYDPDGRPLSAYLWTKTSGPNTPTIVSSTSVSTSVTGLIQGSYVFNLRVTDDSAATANSTVAVTVNAAPTDSILNKPVVYDHAGYETSNTNRPDNYFDGWKVFDPFFNNVTTDTTSTSNPQHGWDITYGSPDKVNYYFVQDSNFLGINYRGIHGPNIWLDLTNYYDPTDTSVQASITGIAFKLKGASGQKFYISRGDDVLKQPMANRDIYLSRMDSLVVRRDSITVSGSDGTIVTRDYSASPIKTRWLVLTIAHSGTAIADASEISIKGTYNTKPLAASMLQDYTDTIPIFSDSSHTFTKVNGYNDFKAVDPNDVRALKRDFVGEGYKYFNSDSTHLGPSPSFEFWPALVATQTVGYMRGNTNYATDLFYTMNGAKYLNAKVGYQFMNIDSPRVQNPELKKSWINAAKFAFNIGAKFGPTAVSSGRTVWTGDGSYPNGLNIKLKTPFGNEDNSHGFTLQAMWAKKNAEWDGDEGRLGSDLGTRSADTTFYNGMVSSAQPDTNYYKVFRQLSWFLRSDHRIPANGVEVHFYAGDTDSSGQLVSLAKQVGQTAAPFEHIYRRNKYNGITWWQQYLRTTFKYLGVIPVYHSEWGIGNDSIAAANQSQAGAIWDIFNIKPFGGWNNYQSKAILVMRQQFYEPFTGVAGNMFYNMTNSLANAGNPDTIGSGLFQSYGLVASNNITAPFSVPDNWKYAPYWYTQSFGRRLSRYAPYGHPTITGNDTTGVWWAMYRNVDDNTKFFVVTNYASRNGTSSSRTIPLPGAANNAVEEVDGSFTSLTPTSTFLTATSGTVTRTVSEKPKGYFFSITASAPSCTTNNTTTSITNTTATLNWNAAAGVTGYKVYLFLNGGSPPGSPSFTTSGTSQAVTGLTAGLTYKFYITPTNASGDASGCGTAYSLFTTTNTSIPAGCPCQKLYLKRY